MRLWIAQHARRADRLLTYVAVVALVACCAVALVVGTAVAPSLGVMVERRAEAVRYVVLYAAPMLFTVPLWIRERFRAINSVSTTTLSIDATVVLLGLSRFVLGTAIPFSGHALFLTYAVATRPLASSYRWLIAVLLIETTVFKLFVWHDPASLALGVAVGCLGIGVAAVRDRRNVVRPQ